jgi:hypothetical protein
MRYLWQLLSKRPQDQLHCRIDSDMEPEEEDAAAKSFGGKMEATHQDRYGPESFRNPSAYVNPISLGGHPPFPDNAPSLQQENMDTTTTSNPPTRIGRLAAEDVEEDHSSSEHQNGPLNLLDLPMDILKDVLGQV